MEVSVMFSNLLRNQLTLPYVKCNRTWQLAYIFHGFSVETRCTAVIRRVWQIGSCLALAVIINMRSVTAFFVFFSSGHF